MARLFDDASSEDLRSDTTPQVTTLPLTMAAWFNSNSSAGDQTILTFVDKDTTADWFRLAIRGDQAENVEAFARGASDNGIARTSTGYSTNTWHHAIAVFTSTTSRSAYIDNGSGITDTDSITTSNLDRVIIGSIGHSSGGSFFSGLIAEVGVWDIALNAAERGMLAAGFSPLMVRPDRLVAYYPLIGRNSPETDIVGGINLTLTNAPSLGAHPRIIYPSMPYRFTAPAAAAPSATWPGYYQSRGGWFCYV